jgi:dimethyl sulfoxide reductase iron-sulfur subunit
MPEEVETPLARSSPEKIGSRTNLSRRRMLRGAGAAAALVAIGAGVTVGLTAPPEVATPAKGESPGPKRQWAMAIDLRKCEGCVTIGKPPQCVEGCNAEHFVPADQSWIQVLEVDGPGGHKSFMPRLCMECENAPCTKVCPVAATYHNDEGIVLINHDRCIGCRMCMAACPYEVRRFNWGEPDNPPGATLARYSPEYPVPHRKGTVEKCMTCAHRVKDGKLPACAAACPMFAIYLGDLTEDVATNGKEIVKFSRFLDQNSAYRLKEELGTKPRVWYIPGHGQDSGHTVDTEIPLKPARTWEEQGATLSADGQPQHDHSN